MLKPPPPAEEPLPPLGAAPAGPKLQPTAQVVPAAAPMDPQRQIGANPYLAYARIAALIHPQALAPAGIRD